METHIHQFSLLSECLHVSAHGVSESNKGAVEGIVGMEGNDSWRSRERYKRKILLIHRSRRIFKLTTGQNRHR